jgi:hypothetical protein
MAKKTNTERVWPQGSHFGIVQLERDLYPKPTAQRIIQWVNRNGEITAYISENAYHRAELMEIFYKLQRMSYDRSITKGSVALNPVKGRYHWHYFSKEFALGEGVTPEGRVDPETDKAETDTVTIADVI